MVPSPTAISVPLPELSTSISTTTALSYTTTDPIATVATLYMPVSDFRAMFDYEDGALKFTTGTLKYGDEKDVVVDGVTGKGPVLVTESSPASIFEYWCKQQSISNGTGGSDNAANIMDSFRVTSSTVNDTDMESYKNILEHCLLEHAFDKFGFIDAFVAHDQVSRTQFASALYTAGAAATTAILNKLDDSGNETSVSANLLLNISKVRTLGESAVLNDVIQEGDSYHFSLTVSNTTVGFKKQQYNCRILLVDDASTLLSVRCAKYSIGLLNSLYLVEEVPTNLY